MAIERIVVPIDFSPHSQRALEVAFEMAGALGACVHAFHFFEPVHGGRAPVGSAGLDPEIRTEALERLKAQVARVDSGDVEVEFEVHPGTNPTTTILEAARSASPDLIVLGTHGRKGLTHAVLGSVAEAVVREAPCPVVTVKAT